MISFLFLISILVAPYLGCYGLDRTVALTHLEKYISVTKSEEHFAKDLAELKEKIANFDQLKASGQATDEADKALDTEIATFRQNIARHASGASADARSKQHHDEIRSRMEESMSKFGKDVPEKFSRPAGTRDASSSATLRDAPPAKDPEELKRLHEDMVTKQREFIAHRKEELTSRISKAGFQSDELTQMHALIDEYINLENEVLESRTQHFSDSSSSMDTNQRVQYHMDMKLKREKEKKASDNARLKRKEIDDALRKKMLSGRMPPSSSKPTSIAGGGDL